MNLKVWRKPIYLFVTLALVLGVAPAAVLASSPADLSKSPLQTVEWNVLGAEQTFNTPDGSTALSNWQIQTIDGLTGYTLLDGGLAGNSSATIRADDVGALKVTVVTSTGTYLGEKKYGEIDKTEMLRWVDLDKDGNVDRGIEWNDSNHNGLFEPNLGEWNDVDGDGRYDLTDELQAVPGSTQVLYEGGSWYPEGDTYVYDRVTGLFNVGGSLQDNLADGAIVHWYLFDASLNIIPLNRLDDEAVLKAELDGLLSTYGAKHVWFVENGTYGQYAETISGDYEAGMTRVSLDANYEEGVRIVALVSYGSPEGVEHMVRPEFFSWNFWSQEAEKVPQVRWAGEKIVLEKYWGVDGYYWAHYSLEAGSPGSLEKVGNDVLLGGMYNDASSVWTLVEDGTSSCILVSEKPGECDVSVSLYDMATFGSGTLVDQTGFVVYFLKLESIDLTKVYNGDNAEYGRTGHNSGLWIDANGDVWDNSDDVTSQGANVSQDELLRVRVTGYFIDDEGQRVTLPDDWASLAGETSEFQEFRPRWDIMDSPNDSIVSMGEDWSYEEPWDAFLDIQGNILLTDPLGPYGFISEWDVYGNPIPTIVAGDMSSSNYYDEWYPVVGPYSTLDDGIPGGNHVWTSLWITSQADVEGRDTIVPNGVLDEFDCPMPPAKITFEILSGPGFFKDAAKSDIYYQLVNASAIWQWYMGNLQVLQYTNPFYAEEIPASNDIPVISAGYGWDSWGWNGAAQGPYNFWTIINRLNNGAVYSSDPGAHPTKVQVYSDNHGEAMVWLNGDWNLNLTPWAAGLDKGYYDVPYMTEVGTTTVVAKADYPYLKKYPFIVSSTVNDTWTWGKDILVKVEQGYTGSDPKIPDATNKRVWVLVSDRDRFPAYESIIWTVDSWAHIEQWTGTGKLGSWDDSNHIWTTDADHVATTQTYFPDNATQYYLESLFGGLGYDPAHPEAFPYAVSSINIYSSSGGAVNCRIDLDERARPNGEPGEGLIVRSAASAGSRFDNELDFGQTGEPGQDPMDPQVDLSAGWNLVSFTGSNQLMANALNSIKGKVVSVWAFDNQSKEWKAYSPTSPAWANDLKMMNGNTCYWIEVSADCTWYYS